MANRFSSFVSASPTARQKRQRELAWALKICMGFRASLHFVPNDIKCKKSLKAWVDSAITEIRAELRSIK